MLASELLISASSVANGESLVSLFLYSFFSVMLPSEGWNFAVSLRVNAYSGFIDTKDPVGFFFMIIQGESIFYSSFIDLAFISRQGVPTLSNSSSSLMLYSSSYSGIDSSVTLLKVYSISIAP